MKTHANTLRRLFLAMLLGLSASIDITFPGLDSLSAHVAERVPTVPEGKPEVSVDLATDEGARLVNGEWRYSDTRIVEVDFKSAGVDGQPTGTANKTYDYTPKAGPADFDDSRWEVIPANSLDQRRSTGRLCFNWYRIKITIPAMIGKFDPAGSTVVFQTTLDDYAEVWVDGELTRHLGQKGTSVVSGWNAPNRLIVGRNVQPGQQIQIALFGINGPLSNPPTNYIWVREARLDFYRGLNGPTAIVPSEVNVEVFKKDVEGLEKIIGSNPKIFKLAEGFKFTEGPVWVSEGKYLLFSDPNSNVIYKYTPNQRSAMEPGMLDVFRTASGYSGADIAEYGQPGSNGLAVDPQGRLTINQHGNHRIVRLGEDLRETVLADKYQGKRLNSPNDLVYRSDSALFFTDPPFGLPKFFDDPRRELDFSGVYSLYRGKLRLLSRDLTGPNGIAFSPDEKYLYVGNWDEKKKVVMRYQVTADARLERGEVFFDFTNAPGEDAIDGIKVDEHGNLYVSGPGGLWVITAVGQHLGTIIAPRHVHNMAWGDDDGKTLYLCARSGVYRMRLNVSGARRRNVTRK